MWRQLRMASACCGAVMVAAAPVNGSAQTDTQFDLTCKGIVHSENIGADDIVPPPDQRLPRTDPYSLTLRVDLNRMAFCTDECAAIEAVAAARADVVVFRAQAGGAFGVGFDSLTIERTSGAFSHTWNRTGDRSRNLPFTRNVAVGTCEKAEFTPLPESAF